MRKCWILLLILALALGGCEAETELSVPRTAIPAEPRPSAEPMAAAPTLTAALPDEAQLDARTTFEVIAAVHAYVLMVGEWSAQDLGLFERQAMIYPLLEVGLAPLGEAFRTALPDPALTAEWQQADEIAIDFTPLALGWAGGSISGEEFSAPFAAIQRRSGQMIESAALTASSLGVETARYEPGYAEAVAAVFGLFPGPAVAEVPEAMHVRPEANHDLLAVEVQPYLYPFAGSDVFLVIGRVENSGAAPLAGVEIEVTFYNFLNEDLGTVRGRLLAETANPGEVYPFSASTVTEGEEAALKDWVRYEVAGYARPVDQASYQSFELTLSKTILNPSGEYQLAGELTNLGDRAVSAPDIRVGVMAFDGAGQLVGVGDGFVLQDVMVAPGDTVLFQAVVDAISGEPVEFRFFAEAAPSAVGQ